MGPGGSRMSLTSDPIICLIVSIVAGDIYGSFERPYCFTETPADGTSFD